MATSLETLDGMLSNKESVVRGTVWTSSFYVVNREIDAVAVSLSKVVFNSRDQPEIYGF